MAIATLICAIVGALAAIGMFLVAASQLRELREQIASAIKYEKIRNTIDACQRFEIDPEIKGAMRELWDNSNNGQDYRLLTEADKFQILILLNYFDGIAIGIEHKIYNDSLVKDQIKDSLIKAVKAFIKGESGEGWIANKAYFSEQQFNSLMKVYKRWNKN